MRVLRILAPMAVLLAAVWGADPAAAQASGGTHVMVSPEPGTPVVALDVLVATNNEGDAGLGYLAARSVVYPLRPTLDSLGARLAVRAEKDALGFRLVVAPDAWEEASRALLVALFRDPVERVAMEAERERIRLDLVGREANPADALRRETDRAVYGPRHPWSQPPAGSAETMAGLSFDEVDRYLRRNLIPGQAVVGLVGPVDAAAATGHLSAFFEGAAAPVTEAEPARPRKGELRKEYDAITTWLSATWLFDRNADLPAVRMVAAIVADALAFGPSQRSVYDVQTEIKQHGGGGELQLRIVVPPEEAERWEGIIRSQVARLADEPLSHFEFADRFRQFRGQRLLELGAPEARAERIARALLLGERSLSEPAADLAALTPERLQKAARALDGPVVVVLGPFF